MAFQNQFPFFLLTRRYTEILILIWSNIAYMPKIELFQTHLSF
jgi:hypothetical protein